MLYEKFDHIKSDGRLAQEIRQNLWQASSEVPRQNRREKPPPQSAVILEVTLKYRIVAVAFGFLTSCSGDRDSLSVVKNGVLEFDKGITVGQAFDHYKYFETTRWKTFRTENGREMVEVIGSVPASVIGDEAFWHGSFEPHPSVANEAERRAFATTLKAETKSVELVVQFQVNQDSSFQIYTVALRKIATDGTPAKADVLDAQEITTTFTAIYRNAQLADTIFVTSLGKPNA